MFLQFPFGEMIHDKLFSKRQMLKKMVALFVESPGKTAVDGLSRGKYYSKISCVIRKGRVFFLYLSLEKMARKEVRK